MTPAFTNSSILSLRTLRLLLLLGEKRCRIISVTAVRQQCHYSLALILRLLRVFDRGVQCSSRGYPDGYSFFFCKKLRSLECLSAIRLVDLVLNSSIENIRNESRAYALDLMGTGSPF